jgi:NAD(P)-dependent dehydrogenase (short-subunit alcohol dehydrogenase family)
VFELKKLICIESSDFAVVAGVRPDNIGHATVLKFLKKGFKNIIVGIHEEKHFNMFQGNDNIFPVMIDVEKPESITNFIDFVINTVGNNNLKVIVSCIGKAFLSPMACTKAAKILELFQINAFGPIQIIQGLLKLIKKANGRIIVLSSAEGRIIIPYLGVYSAAKHALEAMLDSLRIELRPWNVEIIIIEPGTVLTPMLSDMRDFTNQMNSSDYTAEEEQLYLPNVQSVQNALESHENEGMSSYKLADYIWVSFTANSPPTRVLVGNAKFFCPVLTILPTELTDQLICGFTNLPGKGSMLNK